MFAESERQLHPNRERYHRNTHRNAVRREVAVLDRTVFQQVEENPGNVRSFLVHNWVDREGKLSRAGICALWIDVWASMNIEPMISGADECCIMEGSFYTDFMSGLSFVAGAVETGRRELAGEDSDKIFKKAYEFEGVQRTLGDYLREREYAQKCAEKMEPDPTGVGAIDWSYEEVRLGRWQDVFSNSEMSLVLKGAGLAKRLYKAVYPLSDGLGKAAA